MKSTLAAIALLLPAACAGSNSASPAAVEASAGAGTKVAGPQFVELGADEFNSPFTRKTVLMLNGIVGRSLETIREYDGAIADIRAAVGAAQGAKVSPKARARASEALSSLARLAEQAAAARNEMKAAAAALKASGEPYNENILAGMMGFVETVDDEVRAERDKLSARFAGD